MHRYINFIQDFGVGHSYVQVSLEKNKPKREGKGNITLIYIAYCSKNLTDIESSIIYCYNILHVMLKKGSGLRHSSTF